MMLRPSGGLERKNREQGHEGRDCALARTSLNDNDHTSLSHKRTSLLTCRLKFFIFFFRKLNYFDPQVCITVEFPTLLTELRNYPVKKIFLFPALQFTNQFRSNKRVYELYFLYYYKGTMC